MWKASVLAVPVSICLVVTFPAASVAITRATKPTGLAVTVRRAGTVSLVNGKSKYWAAGAVRAAGSREPVEVGPLGCTVML